MMDGPLRIGDVTVQRLVEMTAPLGPIGEFLPNLSAETLAANRGWLQAGGALDDKDEIVLCFQSFLVRTPHHTILVDSCVGNDKERARPMWNQRQDPAWLAALAATGTRVEEIDYVLCTHLHVDHVGWNTRLENGHWVPTFPNARYVFSEKEFAYWNERNAEAAIPHFTDSVLPVVAARRADLVANDFAIGDVVRLLPTPGHTPDHVAVEVGRGRTDAVITGDLLHSPLQMRHPELQMRIDFDPAQAVATRRGFLERFCDSETVCCFAHFPSPSLGRVRRWGEGFRCEDVNG